MMINGRSEFFVLQELQQIYGCSTGQIMFDKMKKEQEEKDKQIVEE